VLPGRHELVQGVSSQSVQRICALAGQYPGCVQGAQVDALVADGDTCAECFGSALAAEHAEWQVLYGEIATGLISRLDPAGQLGIMGFVQMGHGWLVTIEVDRD